MIGWAIAAALALAQPLDSATPSQHWLLVDSDGRIEAIGGPLDRSAVSPTEVRSVWFWSRQVAPTEIAPGDLGRSLPAESEGRCRVRIDHEDGELPKRLSLIGAPLEMWERVPESLLPRWPISENGLSVVPVDAASSWRFRLAGLKVGSWWRDVEPPCRNLTLRPKAAAPLRLEIAGENGQLISDARVYAVEGTTARLGEKKHLARYLAEDGLLSIRPLPEDRGLTLMLTARGYVPAAVRGLPRDLPARLELREGAALSGRFVEREGEPLAGVEIEVETAVGRGFPSFLKLRAESAADGSWRIAALPPHEAVVIAGLRGFAPLVRQLDLEPGETDLGDLVLEPSVELPVRVVNDLGEAVVAAVVRSPAGRELVTDRDGRVVLKDLPADRPVELEVQAAGHLPETDTLRAPRPDLLELRLQRAYTVSGRFADAGGNPVDGGSVISRSGNRSKTNQVASDGRFSFMLEPGRPFELELTSTRTRELRMEVAPGEPGETRDLGTLIAPDGMVVIGRLLSEAAANPIVDARIWAPRSSVKHELVAWFYRDLLEARSDHEGSFSLGGLPFKPAALRIDAPGFARRTIQIRPEPETRLVDLGEIPLSTGATVEVSMKDVDAVGATARVDLGNRFLELDMLSAPVYSGTARIRNVPPGRVTVTVVRDRESLCEEVVTVPREQPELVVTCESAGIRLTGSVRVGGYPSGPGRLSWLPAAVDTPGIIMTRRSSTGLLRHQVFGDGHRQVDVEILDGGYFETDRLRPGNWEVVWLPADGAASPPQPIELPETDELEISLDFRGQSIDGVVEDAEGRTVSGARVRELESGSVTFSDADGSFRLIGLDPGKRFLKAQLGDQASPVVELEVIADRAPEPVVLTLQDARSTGGIPLLVMDLAEQPVPNAFVFVEAAGRGSRVLTTDSEGRAELLLDPPFPSQVRFAAFGSGHWSLGPWMDWPAPATEPIILKQGATGSLRVHSTGQDESGGYLQLVAADGWDVSGLLSQIGIRPSLDSGAARFDGLPVGVYALGIGDEVLSVSVREDREQTIEIENR